MMLTLLLRPAIDGVIPCFFMRGNSPSLGKGLLTEIASLIVFGRRAGLVSVPKNDSEWQTRLDASLMKGSEFGVIDNVLGKLDSQEFASVLTSRVRDCRVLGSSEIRTMPVNTVFAVNGNNVDLDGDLTERSVIIQLAHKDAPNRNIEDFHIQKTYGVSPDIFVENRRAQLLQDLINIICAWKNAGSPRRPKSLMAKYGLGKESSVGLSTLFLRLPSSCTPTKPQERRLTKKSKRQSHSLKRCGKSFQIAKHSHLPSLTSGTP